MAVVVIALFSGHGGERRNECVVLSLLSLWNVLVLCPGLDPKVGFINCL